MKAFIQAIVVAGLLSACAKPGNDTANIQELNQQFISAWNSKDAGKVNAFLADDVHFLQGEVHYTGKSEVSQKWVQETMPTINNLKTSVVTSATDSELAYEAGTFSVDVMPETRDQPRGVGEGNFVLIWKKADDNTWKLSYAQLEDHPVRVKNPGATAANF
ncbi:hypothetical protein GCM10023187_00550 [Nibrella viscosa]|uniref:DUF4440 domain-containing protein n=1 Tax=Nibrella viscosa TaxID=1084524 RepID=A0ABP8JQM1_9BACT